MKALAGKSCEVCGSQAIRAVRDIVVTPYPDDLRFAVKRPDGPWHYFCAAHERGSVTRSSKHHDLSCKCEMCQIVRLRASEDKTSAAIAHIMSTRELAMTVRELCDGHPDDCTCFLCICHRAAIKQLGGRCPEHKVVRAVCRCPRPEEQS